MKDKIMNVIRAMINVHYIAGNMSGGIFAAYVFTIYSPLVSHQETCISDPMGNNHAAFIWCFLFGWVYLAQMQMADKMTTKFLFRVLMPQILIFFVGLYVCGYPVFK